MVLISRLGDNQAHAGDHKVTAPSILTGQGYKENMGQRVGGQNMAQQKGYSHLLKERGDHTSFKVMNLYKCNSIKLPSCSGCLCAALL